MFHSCKAGRIPSVVFDEQLSSQREPWPDALRGKEKEVDAKLIRNVLLWITTKWTQFKVKERKQ